MAYRTPEKTEVVYGSSENNTIDSFKRDVYAGTCSTGGNCVPHQVLRGILKVQVWRESWLNAQRFVIESGKLNVVLEETPEDLDLTKAEEIWLENPNVDDVQPTATPVPEIVPAPILEGVSGMKVLGISLLATSWPSSWVDYLTASGHIVNDFENTSGIGNYDPSNGGTNVSPAEIDIASGADKSGTNPGNYASLQYQYSDSGTPDCDDDYLFLRMRLVGNPSASGGSDALYVSRHWDFLLDANGDGQSDYVLDVFGGFTKNLKGDGGEQGTIGIYPNDPGDTTYTPGNVLWYARADKTENNYTRLETETYGDADSSNDQYWMEIAVPLNANPAFQAALCGKTNLNGLAFASTSDSNTNPLQKDWMGADAFFVEYEEHKSVINITDPGATTPADPAEPGDVLRYTLTVSNTGNLEIPGYVISDDIADILEYADLTNADPDGNGRSGIVSVGIISWPAQDISVGEMISEQFEITVKPVSQWPQSDLVLSNVFGDTVEVYLPDYGSITACKFHDLNANQVWDAAEPALSGWEMTLFPGDMSQNTGANGCTTFPTLRAGDYSISETLQSGWVNTTAITQLVSLADGENETVNFGNLGQGTLIVYKDVINDHGGDRVASAFTINVSAENASPSSFPGNENGTTVTLDPGDYSVDEIELSGYAKSFSGDCEGTIGPGETKECTIINDDIQPRLTVVKVVNGGDKQVSDFNLYVDDTQVVSGIENGFNAGDHRVHEDAEPGYAAVISGDCDAQGNVHLGLDESKTCTITNTRETGNLKAVKVVDDGADLTQWKFSLNGGDPIPANAQGEVDFGQVNTLETHTITEYGPNGYHLVSIAGANCSENPLLEDTADAFVEVGGTTVCIFSNNVNKASLTIIKDAVPNDEQDFSFLAAGRDVGAFILDDDDDDQYSNTQVFSGLFPGVYTVSESTVAGWDLTSAVCDAGNTPDNIVLNPGDAVTCTFTNTKRGAIIVEKQTLPDGAETIFEFTGDVAGFLSDGQQISIANLAPGQYSSAEVLPTGWELTNISCDDNDSTGNLETKTATFNLDPGETVKCTFENSRLPTLVVNKVVINDNGGTLQVADFPLFVNDLQVISGEENIFDVGPYTVTETNQPGYNASYSDDCNGRLEIGDKKVCTITNDDIAPKLKLVKTVVNDNGGNAQINDFQAYIDGNSVAWDQEISLLAGSHTASEDSLSGYLPSLWGGDCSEDGTITLGVGESKTCNITNDDQPAKITLIKEVINNHGGTAVPDDFNLTVDGKAVLSGATTLVDANIPLAIDETQLPGYAFVSIVGRGCPEVLGGSVTLDEGEEITCTLTNDDQFGKIIVTKVTDPLGATEQFVFSSSYSEDFVLANGQSNESLPLVPGTYSVSEMVPQGWDLQNALCDDESTPDEIVLDPEEIVTCTFTNRQRGNLIVTKFLDDNQNGLKDAGEAVLTDWIISLSDQPDQVTDTAGEAIFGNLLPNEYLLSEVIETGWAQTNIYCSNDLQDEVDNDNSHLVIIGAGENVSCHIGNYLATPPELILAKSNNKYPVDQVPGADVTFTLNLEVLDNVVDDLFVTDLPAGGFKYRPGSYKVFLNGTQVLGLPEPIYASPGVWDLIGLGRLNPGDKITLEYLADISVDQDPGLYKDLAWAKATSRDETLVLANEASGIFVGTAVNVIKEQQESAGFNVEKEEAGEVLGAVTELPATGAQTIWLTVAAVLFALGLGFIFKSLRVLAVFVILSFGLLFKPYQIEAADFMIRLEEPKTPNNQNNFEINFVALDIQGRDITVKCYKKGPTDPDVAFPEIQFGSDLVLSPGGNTGYCLVDSGVVSGKGIYEFGVKAFINGDVAQSQVVSVDYSNEYPGTPQSYSKEKLNSCDYKITFKTADDGGKTDKVEVYRSDKTDFTADDGSRVASIGIGSNQETSIINSVPDCNKDYYFAIRAFNNIGNGSGVIGDSVTKVTIVVVQPTSVQGAIPVTGVVIPGEAGVEAEGEVGGAGAIEAAPGEEEAVSNVLGAFASKISWPWRLVILVLLAGIIVYVWKQLRKKEDA